MSTEHSDPLRQLGRLLVEAQQAVALAEAKVGRFNELIRGLREQGRVRERVFLGKTIANPWGDADGLDWVVQAVLLVPEGLGVSRFDAEVFDAHTEDSGGLEDEVRSTFVPFACCSPGEKAFLYAEMPGLFDRFRARVGAGSGK